MPSVTNMYRKCYFVYLPPFFSRLPQHRVIKAQDLAGEAETIKSGTETNIILPSRFADVNEFPLFFLSKSHIIVDTFRHDEVSSYGWQKYLYRTCFDLNEDIAMGRITPLNRGVVPSYNTDFLTNLQQLVLVPSKYRQNCGTEIIPCN